MICLENSACFFIFFCLGFCMISFVSVFPILCFWCLPISPTLYLEVNLTPEPK